MKEAVNGQSEIAADGVCRNYSNQLWYTDITAIITQTIG